MINQEIYKQIMREYEDLQDEAKKRFEIKREICYEKCNRIKEIDEELSLTSIKISKAILSVSKENQKIYIEEIKNLTNALHKEKIDLMKENGFSEHYFEDIYICKKCKDTGFIENKKCSCFKQKLIDKVYGILNISEMIKNEDFSKINLDYYSKEINTEYDMSPYENMQSIMERCNVFIDTFDEKFKNIVFFGEPGVGKTFLCKCIAKEILNKGKIVLYVTAFDLFNMFEKEKFSKDNEKINKDILELTTTADLLIIDDLGTEFITSLSIAELFNIINSRILNSKSTIISTNLRSDELMDLYSTRIVSRLYGEYDMLPVLGKDIRMTKKLGNKV